MIEVTPAQRRARLGWRHRLAAEALAASPVEVARDLVALHGTDPSSVYLAAWARMRDGDVAAAVHRALYEERSLIRLMAMRRTVFVTSLDVAPVLQAACSRAVAARERRKLESMLAAVGVAEDVEGVRRWLDETEQIALRALRDRGEATASELATDDPRLGVEVVIGGAGNQGRQHVASRMLLLLAAEGKVVRGRPRGSWTSHQHTWSPLERWTPGGLAEWDTAQAEVELGRRWLTAFGPGAEQDLAWWAGWSKTQVRRVLAALGAVAVDLGDGSSGYLLPEDLEPAPEPQPWAALLPALDSTPMGWRQRDWFLGEHGPYLFDGFGNIGPSLWWNGEIVGGWAHDRDGEIVVRFLRDVGSEAVTAAQAQAELLAGRLGGVRLTARTRGKTWLEQELSG
ncbi:MAG TPA: winged helix DNA-binding domain-containing protein [Jatrophihabitans sp.]|jgi:hypothetical protein|uniref:winged helix DNA-binding domain-containing protein n=1 Tax=Jatrophihabitans sp. TaxID=1932789 RepID=UPI002EF24FFE